MNFCKGLLLRYIKHYDHPRTFPYAPSQSFPISPHSQQATTALIFLTQHNVFEILCVVTYSSGWLLFVAE